MSNDDRGQFQKLDMEEETPRTANPPRKSRNIIIALIVLLLLLLIIIGVVVAILLTTSKGPRDCKGDHFDALRYTNAKGEQVYIKMQVGDFQTHADALKTCESSESTLWEVEGDKAEWDAVSRYLIGNNEQDVWLNGEVTGRCPGSGIDTCRETEAGEGQGLEVKWLTSGKTAKYSRVSSASESVDCLVVTASKPYLWRKEACDQSYHALCVKRDCIDPDPKVPKA